MADSEYQIIDIKTGAAIPVKLVDIGGGKYAMALADPSYTHGYAKVTASGTAVDLIAAVAAKKIHIVRGTLSSDTACEWQFRTESSNAPLAGGLIGAGPGKDYPMNVETAVANKGLQVWVSVGSATVAFDYDYYLV